MRDRIRAVVACGGTGGHTFPGIAVAKELAARGHDVTVWSSGRAIEGSVLKAWDGAVFPTGARPLTPRNALANVRACWRCWREMRRFKPQVLIAMGSYSSFPPVLAAFVRQVPVVLHEANAVPGRAVTFLARFARAVAVSFPSAAESFSDVETKLTGLPVRAGIGTGTRFEEIPAADACVFVTGGSQGAHRVNELTMRALPMLAADLAAETPPRKLYVIHQTGAADEGAVRLAYTAAGIPARVNAFEREMARAFATADIVVARAGASTCFELAAAGKPAFFIPLPTAVRNHQALNAEYFVSEGAADAGDQNALTARALATCLHARLRDSEKLAAMAQKMRARAIDDAAAQVANLVEKHAETKACKQGA